MTLRHPTTSNTARWAVVLIAAALLGQKAAPRTMAITDFTKEITLTGALGHPLGTYMTVEARILQAPGKTTGILSVDKINDQPLKEPVIVSEIAFSPNHDGGGGGFGGAALPQLMIGKRYQLRGFESAEFVGVPDDPQHPVDPGAPKAQQTGAKQLHLVPKFVITADKDLGWVDADRPGINAQTNRPSE